MSHSKYEYRSTIRPPMTTDEIVRVTTLIRRELTAMAREGPRDNEAKLQALMAAAQWVAKNCMARLRCCNERAGGQTLLDGSALRVAMERKRLFSTAMKLISLMMRIEVGQRKLAGRRRTGTQFPESSRDPMHLERLAFGNGDVRSIP